MLFRSRAAVVDENSSDLVVGEEGRNDERVIIRITDACTVGVRESDGLCPLLGLF